MLPSRSKILAKAMSMFIPDLLQNAITLQLPDLQWNIEGMLFLLHTKRLNLNLRKQIQEQI